MEGIQTNSCQREIMQCSLHAYDIKLQKITMSITGYPNQLSHCVQSRLSRKHLTSTLYTDILYTSIYFYSHPLSTPEPDASQIFS